MTPSTKFQTNRKVAHSTILFNAFGWGKGLKFTWFPRILQTLEYTHYIYAVDATINKLNTKNLHFL